MPAIPVVIEHLRSLPQVAARESSAIGSILPWTVRELAVIPYLGSGREYLDGVPVSSVCSGRSSPRNKHSPLPQETKPGPRGWHEGFASGEEGDLSQRQRQ